MSGGSAPPMTGTERHCAAIRTDPGVARQSVNVDAIVFWLVWNAEKSILEVADFIEAITLSAQTALRGGEHPQNCVAQNHR
jgi:hypothetical protein